MEAYRGRVDTQMQLHDQLVKELGNARVTNGVISALSMKTLQVMAAEA